MSGAMRKIGEYLGLLEDTGHYDDYDGDAETSTQDAVDQRPVAARASSCPCVRPRRAPSSGLGPDWSRGRVEPHHHPAPPQLQRGAPRRRELPRRHARDHEPQRDGRQRRQASRRLRRRPDLRHAWHHRARDQQGLPALPAQRRGRRPRTRSGWPRTGSSTRADPYSSRASLRQDPLRHPAASSSRCCGSVSSSTGSRCSRAAGSPGVRCSSPWRASTPSPTRRSWRCVASCRRCGSVGRARPELPAGDGGSMAAAQRGRHHLRPLEPSVTRVTVPGGTPGAIVS